MRSFWALFVNAMVVLSFGAPVSAMEIRPELTVRGWFFDAKGTIEGEDVEDFGFDEKKGQPEIRGSLGIGRHDLELSFLRVSRKERSTTTVVSGPLGFAEFEEELFMDLKVRDLRGRYGYRLVRNRWVELEPFLAIAYVTEEADIRNETFSQSSRSDESAVFPLPGVDLVFFGGFPVHLKARASGIGAGGNHIIDVEGGVGARVWRIVGGVGFRHVDLLIDGGGDSGVDLNLNGFYIEGGIRF